MGEISNRGPVEIGSEVRIRREERLLDISYSDGQTKERR